MAICSECNREMKDKVSCVEEAIEIDGKKCAQIPYGQEVGRPHPDFCHDCATPIGGFHHPGCDAEICPVCKYQIISCGCLDDEEEGEE